MSENVVEPSFPVTERAVTETLQTLANEVRARTLTNVITILRDLAQDERNSLTWWKRILTAYTVLFRPGAMAARTLDACADGLEVALRDLPDHCTSHECAV